MAVKYYLPKDFLGLVNWLQNFSNKLAVHAAALGLDPAVVAAVRADAAFLIFILTGKTAYIEKGKEWTAFKNLMMRGKEDASVSIPVAPNLGTIPLAVLPGIITRIQKLVQQIKENDNYNEAMGKTWA